MSRIFYDKLSASLEDVGSQEFAELLESSFTSFSSMTELKNYLCEGTMLNVNTIGSRALSIPNGEYMVWMTDAGHTMLVPTDRKASDREVFEGVSENYEVHTKDLLKAYNGLSKLTLKEAKEGDEKESDDDGIEADFQLSVDKSTVDRTPILRAMEDLHYTVTDLAKATDVDPPAISRILRKPSDGPGDPGGRNPSIGLAARICSVLSIDPRSAFPDIFVRDKRAKAKKVKGNKASGSGTLRSKAAFQKNKD